MKCIGSYYEICIGSYEIHTASLQFIISLFSIDLKCNVINSHRLITIFSTLNMQHREIEKKKHIMIEKMENIDGENQ